MCLSIMQRQASRGRKPSPESLRPRLALIAFLLFAAPCWADLRFAQSVIDAGQVRSGPALVQRFHFLNDGTQPVEITETRPGCGCLKPKLPKQRFAPGEEGWIEVEVNTLSQPAGPNQWRVQLFYRNGNQPREAMLQVNARLTKEVLVEPAALSIRARHAIAHEITVTDLRVQPLTVTAVQASAAQLRCQLQPPRRDAGGRPIQVIRLEVRADYPEGSRDETVTIYTDDPAYRELRVPVTVAKPAKQRISATPPEVRLTAPPGQPIPSRIILLRDADDQPVILEKITADDPALKFRWAEGPGAMTTVKVQVDAGQLRDGKLQGVLHVQVRQPVPQTIHVPVTINGN
jgi:hypothetical protein